jgi:hypothetical protein
MEITTCSKDDDVLNSDLVCAHTAVEGSSETKVGPVNRSGVVVEARAHNDQTCVQIGRTTVREQVCDVALGLKVLPFARILFMIHDCVIDASVLTFAKWDPHRRDSHRVLLTQSELDQVQESIFASPHAVAIRCSLATRIYEHLVNTKSTQSELVRMCVEIGGRFYLRGSFSLGNPNISSLELHQNTTSARTTTLCGTVDWTTLCSCQEWRKTNGLKTFLGCDL